MQTQPIGERTLSPTTPPVPNFSPTPLPTLPDEWIPGCPDGCWGGISHHADASYSIFNQGPGYGWACQPNNPEGSRIPQENIEAFQNAVTAEGGGGDEPVEYITLNIDGMDRTVMKTFGHSLDTKKQGCGQCWLIRPANPEGQW